MSKRHPKIPAEIDAELSPRARKFFGDMIDDYERRIAALMKRVEELEGATVGEVSAAASAEIGTAMG